MSEPPVFEPRAGNAPRPALPPIPRDPRQPADFDPAILGRALLRASRVGLLATLDPETGFPFATLVNVATDSDGAPLILISRLATHTRNLIADPRVSLLLSKSGQSARAEKGDPLAHPRLTVQARARRIKDGVEVARAQRRFLARHPKAQIYVGFEDFAFFRLEPETVHLNGGFARAFDGDARYLTAPLINRAAFDTFEQTALAHLKAQESERIARFAARLAGRIGGTWHASALDPDGLDLMAGDEILRLPFPSPISDMAGLAEALDALEGQAGQADAGSNGEGSADRGA